MKRGANIIWGVLLIGGGVLLLLQNLGDLESVSNYLWTFLFGVFGLSFLVGFALDRSRWWALIPGIILLSIGAVVGLSFNRSPLVETLSGPIVLGGIALAFWAVYAVRREFWWAIIPAGTLTTLAVVAGIAPRSEAMDTGGIFFLGLAVTFGLVFLLTRMQWPLIPAAVLAVLGVFFIVGLSALINYLWPIALILAGAFLLFRVLRPR
jgi:hypothetical protein